MPSEVIREFLVSLNYKVDPSSQQSFEGSITKATLQAKLLGDGLEKAAASGFSAIEKLTKGSAMVSSIADWPAPERVPRGDLEDASPPPTKILRSDVRKEPYANRLRHRLESNLGLRSLGSGAPGDRGQGQYHLRYAVNQCSIAPDFVAHLGARSFRL